MPNLTSGGKPCVILEDGSVCFRSDAVQVGKVWYRKGEEPVEKSPASPPPKTDSKTESKGSSSKGDKKQG